MIKRFTCFLVALVAIQSVTGQMDIPPNGFNPRATISEDVGITSITIAYSRPGVKGREGRIWGDLVPNGFGAFNFIDNALTSPWRAGANQATTIEFEHDVKVEGRDLPAGKYALFMATGEDEVTLIFSTLVEAWGSYNYQSSDDVLRVRVKPEALERSVEWLKYEFVDHEENSCVIALQWEKRSIPFKVEVDVQDIVLARMREEFKGVKGFISANRLHAALYCFEKNINMEEALGWMQMAITGRPFGQSTFDAYDILAQGYEKMNRFAEADSVIDVGLPVARLDQYIAYSQRMIKMKRATRGVEAMLAAKDKFGDLFDVNNTLAYAYAAGGEYQNAIICSNRALSLASDEKTKKVVQDNIEKLKNHEDINR